MKKFIAYFDYLGFKMFIENNDISYQRRIVLNNLRDIESALGRGKRKETTNGVVSEISDARINCINFSDTVVFFSNDDSIESLQEILEVAHTFNWQAIGYFFPVRGVIVYGDLVYFDYRKQNDWGSIYNINSVFGKGLVASYLKANNQNWAGSVIDESVIIELKKRKINHERFLKPYAKEYLVPYKDGKELLEYALCLVEGKLDNLSFDNYRNGIKKNFEAHGKSIDDPKVREKLTNTILFLESFKKE